MDGGTRAATTWTPRAGARLLAALLVAAMALGSIAMWLASPVGWLWVASQFVSSQTPSLGGYALAFLDRSHAALVRPPDDRPRQSTWLRSMRDSRGAQAHDESVLTQVMLISVGVALAVAGIWYFGFAGSSIS